jgi:hypothetical protein
VEISDGAIIKLNYELCVKVVNKSNIQPETPSIVTLSRGNMYIRESWFSQQNDSLLAKILVSYTKRHKHATHTNDITSQTKHKIHNHVSTKTL